MNISTGSLERTEVAKKGLGRSFTLTADGNMSCLREITTKSNTGYCALRWKTTVCANCILLMQMSILRIFYGGRNK